MVRTMEGGTATADPAHMGYYVRPMRPEDISQVSVTEQECFPAGWGPTPFQRELQNKSAAYLIACKAVNPGRARDEARALMSAATPTTHRPLLSRLMDSIKHALSPPVLPQQDHTQHIAAYAGLWFVVDEAHITAIGTREADRRQGIGELLILASVELALRRGATMVTLETRVSNYPAQGLYVKYGFREVGVRKGYYTDNHEDALVMTTPNITTLEYQDRFAQLVEEHAQRWGSSVRIVD